jgi:hypothetical protein
MSTRGHRLIRELYESTEVTVAPDAPVGEDIDAEDETPDLNHLSVAQLWELARRQLAAQPRHRSKRPR